MGGWSSKRILPSSWAPRLNKLASSSRTVKSEQKAPAKHTAVQKAQSKSATQKAPTKSEKHPARGAISMITTHEKHQEVSQTAALSKLGNAMESKMQNVTVPDNYNVLKFGQKVFCLAKYVPMIGCVAEICEGLIGHVLTINDQKSKAFEVGQRACKVLEFLEALSKEVQNLDTGSSKRIKDNLRDLQRMLGGVLKLLSETGPRLWSASGKYEGKSIEQLDN
eukprot:1326034-Rhodomonas_salina.2